MWLIDKIAEERIHEARRKGEFDNLAGTGKPLELDDDTMVPAELRAGYRLLKNAGFVPQELVLRREINEVESLLATVDHGEERDNALRRLDMLMTRLNMSRGNVNDLRTEQQYYQKILQKLDNDR